MNFIYSHFHSDFEAALIINSTMSFACTKQTESYFHSKFLSNVLKKVSLKIKLHRNTFTSPNYKKCGKSNK